MHQVEPFQVFDNLYYIGMDNISAWALTTSEGIILFEAMMVANWEQTVVNGLTTLGLDPNDIKYIGHAHNDRWGGAAFLQQRYGAEILMGEPDWDHIRNRSRGRSALGRFAAHVQRKECQPQATKRSSLS